MGRIVYRGAFATFPVVGINPGDLAYATDILILFEWSGVAWMPYHDYPDYEGQKSKLYTAADWAALEATDQNLRSIGVNQVSGATTTNNYMVPAGRNLYITQFSVTASAVLVADRDNNQMCQGILTELLGVGIQLNIGGNGGASIVFNKPLVFRGGFVAQFSVTNYANHNCNIIVSAGGYLI